MTRRRSARISPTALYTGHVWQRHALAPAALATKSGALLFRAVDPIVRLGALGTGGATIESFLVARHRLIDELLARRIEQGAVAQVVEIAAGLSGRGHRFAARYEARGLVYVEGDLPAMASRKREALERAGALRPRHHVVALDALADGGAESLGVVGAERLDPTLGTAVVCEGLVSYLDPSSLGSFWTRVARWLGQFPAGLYLGDLYLAGPDTTALIPTLFLHALSAFARTRVRMHFASSEDVEADCRARGFDRATVEWPAGQTRAHVAVLRAETGEQRRD